MSGAGSGLGTTDQLVPSQDSAKVVDTPLVDLYPTAMHTAADTHDTLVSWFWGAGLRLGTTDQVRSCALAGTAVPARTNPASTTPARRNQRPASRATIS